MQQPRLRLFCWLWGSGWTLNPLGKAVRERSAWGNPTASGTGCCDCRSCRWLEAPIPGQDACKKLLASCFFTSTSRMRWETAQKVGFSLSLLAGMGASFVVGQPGGDALHPPQGSVRRWERHPSVCPALPELFGAPGHRAELLGCLQVLPRGRQQPLGTLSPR